jgi:hypothetical protein
LAKRYIFIGQLGLLIATFMSEEDRAELLHKIAENQKLIIWLEPHENATQFDHPCKSPILAPIIQRHIEIYNKKNGDYR